MIPSALVLAGLALAALRVWRLMALDTFPPLVWMRDRLVGYDADLAYPVTLRPLLAEWLQCQWCSGLWISAGWYVAWLEWPHGSLYAAVPLALSALVGIAQTLLPD